MPEQKRAKGDAFAELMFEVTTTFYRFRAAGQMLGFVNKKGGGTIGVMRSLAIHGPTTVSDLARMRPTSRQRIQQIADELLAAGIVEFIDNANHKSAKLARLTTMGQKHYREMLHRMRTVGEALAYDVAESDMRAATEIMRHLRKRLTPE